MTTTGNNGFDLSKFQDLSMLESSDDEQNHNEEGNNNEGIVEQQNENELELPMDKVTEIDDDNCLNSPYPVPAGATFDRSQFQDLAALESTDDEDYDDTQQIHTMDSKKKQDRKSISFPKIVILGSKSKQTEELLVTGYLRQYQSLYNLKLPSNILYECNVSYGSIKKKYTYKFGDITKKTIKVTSKATKSAGNAVKNYRFGDITKSIFRRVKKKNKE